MNQNNTISLLTDVAVSDVAGHNTYTHTHKHALLSAAKVMRHLETFQTKTFTLSLCLIHKILFIYYFFEISKANSFLAELNINSSACNVEPLCFSVSGKWW